MSDLQEEKTQRFTMRVGESMYQRLEKCLILLKKLDDLKLSRQQWLIQAIQEKIEKDDQNPDINAQKDRRFVVDLSERLATNIDQRVELLKKIKGSCSRKQWVTEAILEKLEKDEGKARRMLEEIQMSKAYFIHKDARKLGFSKPR